MCVHLPQTYSNERLFEEHAYFTAARDQYISEGYPEFAEWYQPDIDKLEKEIAERGLMVAAA